mgnify:CR=1 FL=1
MPWHYLIVAIPILLFSLTFHEAAHAFVANRRGDDTARLAGRLTLNPLPHIDPIGTVILPLVLIITGAGFIIGAAKPVPVDARNLYDPRRDMLAVALSGPASNFLLAAGFFVLLQLAYMAGLDPLAFNHTTFQLELGVAGFLSAILKLGILYNLILGGFNLLPIPPLDGFGIIEPYLTPELRMRFRQIGMMGIFLIFFLFLYIQPVQNAFWRNVYEATDSVDIPGWMIDEGYQRFMFWRFEQ